MQFGVIYSIDAEDIWDGDRPPELDLWEMTEEGESEYDIEGLKHEKWCACLSLEQFEAFVRHCDLDMADVETMGSIGAPSPLGVIPCVMPAVCFECDNGHGMYDAYVTPYVEKDDDIPGFVWEEEAENWEVVRNWMLNKWGY